MKLLMRLDLPCGDVQRVTASPRYEASKHLLLREALQLTSA